MGVRTGRLGVLGDRGSLLLLVMEVDGGRHTQLARQCNPADAVFVRHVQRLDGLSDAQCLKLAVLALVYGSPDLTHFSLAAFDRRRGTQLSVAFLQAFGA